jgi:chloramphenicol-sensitive protein RarD
LIFFATSSILAVNWLVYIRAVNSGFIVDASLGYFINPVVSVLLGVIFLKERLRIWQWITVLIAFFGVLYLTISYGSLPKIGLILAFTFGIYGLVRKLVPLKSIHGFTLETGFMVIPALIYLMMLYNGGPGTMGQTTINQTLLLVLTGFVTALPLVMFGVAALLINLSTLGFIQYIAPTLQFLIGVLVYGEAFTQDRLIGFGVIWIALAIFTIEGAFARRKIPVTTPAD